LARETVEDIYFQMRPQNQETRGVAAIGPSLPGTSAAVL
jgi:hypothetical protein